MTKRILVIDDDPGVRETFTCVLEDSGYEVSAAQDGQSGVDSATLATPDLVFLDLKMPGMNGVETLRCLADVCPQTPVYIVTGFYEELMEPLRALKDRGICFDVARKPLTLVEIKAIADAVLAPSAAARTFDMNGAQS